MLLICPECRTRYVVPDSAIGAAGRQVRCANCRHSWFQDGAKMEEAAPAPAIVAPPVAAEAPRVPEPVAAETAPFAQAAAPVPSDDSLAQPAFASFSENPPSPVAEPPPPPSYDRAPQADPAPSYAPPAPDRSQFAHEPPFKPRRNPAKLMTYAAIAFALLIAVLGTVTWYFGWFQGSFAAAGKEPDLKIVLHDNLQLGRDADGSPYFIASGSIVNPTAETQKVPELLVTLKDAGGRSVYSWTMKAPKSSLAPGAKMDFSQLRRDVPLAASRISVGWALGN
jgi:predicted Zn finger-like uncharacterized protein